LIFFKIKDIYKGEKPEIYNLAGESELLSKQKGEETELLIKRKELYS
jgi:hypothetical protein